MKFILQFATAIETTFLLNFKLLPVEPRVNIATVLYLLSDTAVLQFTVEGTDCMINEVLICEKGNTEKLCFLQLFDDE
jgi:hypothetical protein